MPSACLSCHLLMHCLPCLLQERETSITSLRTPSAPASSTQTRSSTNLIAEAHDAGISLSVKRFLSNDRSTRAKFKHWAHTSSKPTKQEAKEIADILSAQEKQSAELVAQFQDRARSLTAEWQKVKGGSKKK
eukprot:m.184566 g.184566  ORF g.184566 m.184566 type:complete len:132 (-) comp10509_c1_seq3:37-432(-)